MEESKITLKGKNGKKHEYRVILAVEGESVMENLILYTDDKVNKSGEVNVYAIKIDINGAYKKVTKKEFKFLNKLLISFQSEGKRE